MSNMNIKTTTQKIFKMRILIRKNWMGYQKRQEKDKENYEDASEGNGTQDMKMDDPEEEMILDYDEDKDNYVINEEEVDFQECGDRLERVNLCKYQKHSGITTNNLFN